MKNIIFIAAPASGKGTFSKLLEEKCGYAHLALGDVLREQVEKGNEEVKNLIENGRLVSDELIASIIKEKISTLKDKPFIIDGCPRTLNQAIMLNEVLKEESVTDVIIIKLNIDKETAVKRMLGRLVCKCGKSYNIYNEDAKPKIEGVCDICSSKLEKRKDDTEEKIIDRFTTYEENLKPIEDYYKKNDKFYEIDSRSKITDTFEVIRRLIND